MKKRLFLIPLLVLALLLTACRGKAPDNVEEPDVSTTTSGEAVEGDTTTTTVEGEDAPNTDDDTTTQGDNTTKDNKTTTKGDATTTKNDDKKPSDNVVNWEDFFGDDDTTTTTGKNNPTKNTTKGTAKDTTKGTANGTTKQTTSTTKTSTTTAPTTTVKPTVIDKVTLPAVGTDVDGRNRIKVSAVSFKDGVMGITIRNYTDEQKTQWITEETDYVTYACYDKDGNELKGSENTYGYLYLGCLENGKETSFSVVLPKGTATVRLTGAKIVYWTPWS